MMSIVAADVAILCEDVKSLPPGLDQENETGRSPSMMEQTGWTVASGRPTVSLNEMESLGGTANINKYMLIILQGTRLEVAINNKLRVI